MYIFTITNKSFEATRDILTQTNIIFYICFCSLEIFYNFWKKVHIFL